MGIETIIGVISLVVGAVGGVVQMNAANSAADAQKDANRISGNQQQINSLEDQRQRVREERVRRAQIIAASENQGSDSSSGEAGALGSLSTNFGTLISGSRGQSIANTGINAANQRAQDSVNFGNTVKSLTDLTQNGLDTFGTIFDKKGK